MARAADGTMTLTGTFAVANTIPVSTTINGYVDDIITELTDSLSRSGKGAMLAALAMGSQKITGLTDGAALTDAATVKQVQNRNISFIDGAGTADAITAAYSPVITAVVDGMTLFVEATAANATTTPTFSPNGLTARTIKKLAGTALLAGDIAGDGHVLELQYHASGTYWNLLNPATASTAVSLTSVDFTVAPSTDQTDYAAITGAGHEAILTISATASININSVVPGNCKRLTVVNGTAPTASTATIFIIPHEHAASTAANRFVFGDRRPRILFPQDTLTFVRSGTRWVEAPRAKFADVWTNFNEGPSSTTGNFFISSGTGAALSSNSLYLTSNTTQKPFGGYEAETGTTTTGGLSIQFGNTDNMDAAAGVCAGMVARLAVQALSTAGEEYSIRCGLIDMTAADTDVTDGMYWEYLRGTSTVWSTVVAGASTRTKATTGPTVDTDFIELLVFVNGDYSRVDFAYSQTGRAYTWVASATGGNIPAATEKFGIRSVIKKSAGTTTRLVTYDFFGGRYDGYRGTAS